MKMTRRVAGRLIVAAPFAAAPLAGLLGTGGTRAAEEPGPPPPTPLARFLAKEEGLSAEERERVKKDVTQLEQALRVLRDFRLGNDVPPAGLFQAMKSKRA